MGRSYKEKENPALQTAPHQDAAKELKAMAPPQAALQAGAPVQMATNDNSQTAPMQMKKESPDEMMENQSGVQVSNQSLNFGMTMGANQTLIDQPPNTVHTGKKGVRANTYINEEWLFRELQSRHDHHP